MTFGEASDCRRAAQNFLDTINLKSAENRLQSRRKVAECEKSRHEESRHEESRCEKSMEVRLWELGSRWNFEIHWKLSKALFTHHFVRVSVEVIYE